MLCCDSKTNGLKSLLCVPVFLQSTRGNSSPAIKLLGRSMSVMGSFVKNLVRVDEINPLPRGGKCWIERSAWERGVIKVLWSIDYVVPSSGQAFERLLA